MAPGVSRRQGRSGVVAGADGELLRMEVMDLRVWNGGYEFKGMDFRNGLDG